MDYFQEKKYKDKNKKHTNLWKPKNYLSLHILSNYICKLDVFYNLEKSPNS